MIRKVGNFSIDQYKIPDEVRSEEIVRGEFKGWYIIDPITLNRKFFKTLTEEQKQINPSGLWNPALLIEKLENNWSIDEWNKKYIQ